VKIVAINFHEVDVFIWLVNIADVLYE